MFYEPGRGDHGLPRDPFKALVAPRPIGWISTVDGSGRPNLAPYSFFNAFGSRPPIVGFSSEGAKHSKANAEATGAFVCNMATYELREAMNATSAPLPAGESEFAFAGLAMAPSRLVAAPRVAASPVALECRYLQTVVLTDLSGEPSGAHLVLGQVVGVHIADEMIVDGFVDLTRLRPLGRLGYLDYCVVDSLFSIERPPGG